jgi:hypothetical protein
VGEDLASSVKLGGWGFTATFMGFVKSYAGLIAVSAYMDDVSRIMGVLTEFCEGEILSWAV